MIDLKIHTDDPKIKIACLRYWNRNAKDEFTENVTFLAADYGKTIPAFIKFVNKYSTAYHTEVVCNECEKRYVYTSRSDYKEPYLPIKNHYTCEECTQRLNTERYYRENAREEAIRHFPYAEFLKENFGEIEGLLVTPKQMSFKQAVYLLSLIRHSASENYNIIYPLGEEKRPFSPTAMYTENIITYLVSSGFINLHPATDTATIQLEDGKLVHFEPEKVCWQLTIGDNPSQRDKIIRSLEDIFREKRWPEHWEKQRLPLCREVTLYECLEYLAHLAEETIIPNPQEYFGERTRQVLHHGLEQFSVSQMVELMTTAFSEANKRIRTEQLFYTEIVTIITDQLLSEIEQAANSGTNIEGLQRIPKCPESTISKVLFRSVLKKEGGSFDTVFPLID